MQFKLILLISTLIFVTFSSAKNLPREKYATLKEHCILASEYTNTSNKKLKSHLIQQVKRDAVEELFGTSINSNTLIVDGKMVSDQIKQNAVGNVRIKGNPKFYNGKDFGEVCTKVEAYITQADFEKYQPKYLKFKNFCHNNPSVSLQNLKAETDYAAYKKAIIKFKPSLKNISNKKAESLIHAFSKQNEHLDIQTGVFCMDFAATVFPYELEALEEADNTNSEQYKNSKNGLEVTFYKNRDYYFKRPIYKTTIHQDLSLFNKSFINNKLKKNQAYYIRIQGFLYSTIDRFTNYKLKSDVYNVEIKINNQQVVSKHSTKGGVVLKAGYNPIEILLTSSNAYDIELLERQDNRIYIPLSKSKLFIKG